MEPIMTEDYQLYNGDCLEVMDELIKQGIKVDCIITDPPFGTTACKWDQVIPFEEMWQRLNALIKDNGAIILFGSEPFSSQLRCSNLKHYRYDWIWDKQRGTNFQHAKKMPMKSYENIMVFYKKLPTYNPQMREGKPYQTKGGFRKNKVSNLMELTEGQKEDIETIGRTFNAGVYREATINEGKRYPLSILSFKKDGRVHPTQKPVALLEYLIKTYTNEEELVLDFTMGSGSTIVAALNTGRKAIGIELDDAYYDIAKHRTSETQIHRTNENENREGK